MRIHVTCSKPTRAIVLALRAVRELLAREGNTVSCGVLGCQSETGGLPRLGFELRPLATAHVIVHACHASEAGLPEDIEARRRAGTPVIRLTLGHESEPSSDWSDPCVSRVEEVLPAVSRMAALSVG